MSTNNCFTNVGMLTLALITYIDLCGRNSSLWLHSIFKVFHSCFELNLKCFRLSCTVNNIVLKNTKDFPSRFHWAEGAWLNSQLSRSYLLTKITVKKVSNCLRFIKHSFNKISDTLSNGSSDFNKKCSTMAEKRRWNEVKQEMWLPGTS